MKVSTGTAPKRAGWFKTLRVAVLLLVLSVVSLTAWLDHYRSTRWREPLFVAIYPIAADASTVTRAYLDSLDGEAFKDLDAFFAREAARHHLATAEPVRSRLRPELKALPPARDPDAGILSTIFWSLRLRYWAWSISRHAHEPADIRIFVLYHDPALAPTVPHSLGLSKGLIGVVYAFSEPAMNRPNNVVIAHELLHAVGASDKYDPANDAPIFPGGYGDPNQIPLLPQKYAELMAGRRMLNVNRWEQVSSLDQVVIGSSTALEIRWPPHAYR